MIIDNPDDDEFQNDENDEGLLDSDSDVEPEEIETEDKKSEKKN